MNPVLFRKGLKATLLISAFAFAASGSAWGVKMISKGEGGEGKNIPVHVRAERMEVDHASKRISFIGNVVTTRGDMVIRSDGLDVYNSSSGEGTDKIRKIVARGNVHLEQGSKRASGDKAVYLASEQTVVLTGRVRAWDGDNEVTGRRITIYLDEDKSVVEGDADKRVEVSLKSQVEGQGALLAKGKLGETNGTGEALPIFVTADRMEVDHRQRTVFFEGKVNTKRADFSMDSDDLEVFDSGEKNSRISKIIARGNVRLDRGGKVATGDKAIYYERERKFLLTGHAKAWENQNVVAGSRMEIYLDEDKSVVLGDGKEQVEVTIYPREAPAVKQPLPPPALSEEGPQAASR